MVIEGQRSLHSIAQGARQYSQKTTREPLQAAAPWKQAIIAGGLGLAGYYAYTSLGGNAKEAVAKVAVPATKVFTGGMLIKNRDTRWNTDTMNRSSRFCRLEA
jgi:hypothetical protein